MKKLITKLALVTVVLLFGNSLKSSAQAVTPATPGVQLVCEGSPLNLGSPGTTNQWIVKYDATSATPSSPTTLTLAANTIAAADVKTGYYLITNKSTAAGACESDIQTIAVFVLPTLVPTFTSADYCTENAATTTFTATVTPTSLPTGATLAYQWYTVIGGTEAAVPSATSATFNPTITNTTTSSVNATYRLKVAYEIGGLKYCIQTIDHTVAVLPRPTTPTISVGNTGQATL